jgi:hypothetical protein
MDEYTSHELAYNNGFEAGKRAAFGRTRCKHCCGRSYTEKPFKVITQMGKEVMVQFNFCPNCGADMREPPKGE